MQIRPGRLGVCTPPASGFFLGKPWVPLTPTLGAIAAARGFKYGSCIQHRRMGWAGPNGKDTLHKFIAREMGHYVSGYYGLPDHTESPFGVFPLSGLTDFAADVAANGKTMSLHALMVPHKDDPTVVAAVSAMNPTQAEAAMRARFVAMKASLNGVDPYRIDVGNELQRPNGATASDGKGYKYNHWYTAFGSGKAYIACAFRLARELWPNALLAYCDNSIEQQYEAFRVTHAANVVNMLAELIADGVPIDIYSSQAHLEADKGLDVVKLVSTYTAIAGLGLGICISELDCQHPNPTSPTAAQEIADCIDAFLAVALPFCTAKSKEIITWGVYDRDHSWAEGQIPLPYDRWFNARPFRNVLANRIATVVPLAPSNPPELNPHGTFDANLDGWIVSFGTATVVAGKAHLEASGGVACRIYKQFNGLVPGRTYNLVFDRVMAPSNPTTGQVYVSTGNTTGGAIATDTALTTDLGKVLSFVATQTTHFVLLGISSTTAGRYAEFDNVSLKQATPL